jgi:hypothetical protein
VIERCLAKDPDQRYQTAAEITTALKKVLADQQSASVSSVVHVYSPPVRQSSPYQMDASGPEVISQESGPKPATGPINAGAPVAGTVANTPLRRKWWVAGGCALAALIIVCLAAGAALIAGQLLGGGGSSQAAALDLVPTQTMVAQTRDALSTAVSAMTETAAFTSIPPTPTLTSTEIPTQTPASTSTLDPNQPTPVPPGMPYVLITGITLEGDKYIVNYETLAFIESISSQHIHFFFNTTKVEDAGVPGKGPYIMHAGPRPFSEVTIFDTPPDATQICALVANPDHTINPDSGNCIDLPLPEGGIPTPTAPPVPPTQKPEKDNGGGYNY